MLSPVVTSDASPVVTSDLSPIVTQAAVPVHQIVCVQQNFFEPGAGFPPAQRASGLWGLQQDVIQRIDGREDLTVIPWAVPGTFRNLTISSNIAPGVDSWAFTAYVDQIATALTVPMTGSGQIASDLTHSFHVAAGDEVGMRGTTSNTPIIDWSWEFESDTPNESAYGALVGVLGISRTNLSGALGTGTRAANIGGSICSCDCTMTTTRLRSSASAPPGVGETYTATVLLTRGGVSVLQDGTGGTVDTVCTIGGLNTKAFRNYSLRLVPGDIVGMVTTASPGAPSSGHGLAFGVACTSINPGEYTTCGAMDPAGVDPQYVWEGSTSGTEVDAACIVGSAGLVLSGLRVYQTGPQPGGATFTYALRKNEADPANQPIVTITGLNSSGTDTNPAHRVAFVFGDVLDLKLTGAIGGNRVNWGFLTTTAGSLVVEKVTSPPAEPDAFGVTVGGGLTPSSFNLEDGQSQSYPDVPPGSGYSVAETVPAGWALVTTVSNGSPANNISIGPGEAVTVTLTNTKTQGTLIVRKVTDPPAFPLSFAIAAGGGLTPSTFSLSDGDEQDFTGVPAGSGYSILETVPPGWNLSVLVSNGSPVNNITIAPDETVIVTLTNTHSGEGRLTQLPLEVAYPYNQIQTQLRTAGLLWATPPPRSS